MGNERDLEWEGIEEGGRVVSTCLDGMQLNWKFPELFI
jgi:hypothetical protein